MPSIPAAAAVPTSTGTMAAGRVRGRAPAIQAFMAGQLARSRRSRPNPPGSSLDPMRELVAIALTGAAFVDRMVATWERGDAVLPIAPNLPAPALEELLRALAPPRLVDPDGTESSRPDGRQVEDDDSLVIPTSG